MKDVYLAIKKSNNRICGETGYVFNFTMEPYCIPQFIDEGWEVFLVSGLKPVAMLNLQVVLEEPEEDEPKCTESAQPNNECGG
jgi:hypothetical protein